MKIQGRMGALGTLLAVIGLLIALPATASAKDRNNDNIPDRWEKRHGLSLKVNQAKRDQDSDDLNNRGEFRAGTDPLDEDSDGDGVEDGDEGAGTVSSYDPDTGELVINVFNGRAISGLVTEDTRIRCDDGDDSGDEDADDQGAGQRRPGHGGPGGDDHCGGGVPCGVEELVEGAVIQEARLSVVSGTGLVYDEIEILTDEEEETEPEE